MRRPAATATSDGSPPSSGATQYLPTSAARLGLLLLLLLAAAAAADDDDDAEEEEEEEEEEEAAKAEEAAGRRPLDASQLRQCAASTPVRPTAPSPRAPATATTSADTFKLAAPPLLPPLALLE